MLMLEELVDVVEFCLDKGTPLSTETAAEGGSGIEAGVGRVCPKKMAVLEGSKRPISPVDWRRPFHKFWELLDEVVLLLPFEWMTCDSDSSMSASGFLSRTVMTSPSL
jgi:hypothetical protein